MGESNSLFVFKGPTLEVFRDALVAVVAEKGGRLDWDVHPEPIEAKLLTSHRDNVHAAYIHCDLGKGTHAGGFEVAYALGKRLAVPWLNLRIQEGTLWDYSLFHGETHLDNFSTLPEYWDDDPEFLASQRGNPELLAREWGLPPASIVRYLQSWATYPKDRPIRQLLAGIANFLGLRSSDRGDLQIMLRGKAYPKDRHAYGDIWQMTDFLRALGAHDPNWDQPHCVPRLMRFEEAK